jgi:hypothetical protein
VKLADNPWIKLCRTLTIDAQPVMSSSGEFEFADGAFILLLLYLSNLTELNLFTHSHLVKLALSSNVGIIALSKLVTLRIKAHLPGFYDPFHPVHFQTLQCCSELRKLEIDYRVGINLEQYREIAVLPRFTITDLELTGGCNIPTALPLFISSCPNLLSLSVRGLFPLSETPRLIDAIHSPHLIEDLTLQPCDGSGDAFAPLLARFPSVRRLRVGKGLTSTSAEHLSLLRSLPLESLTFYDGSFAFSDARSFDLRFLLPLVHPSSHHPSLRTIDFDLCPHAKFGTSIVKPDGSILPVIDENDGLAYVYSDWVEPRWYDAAEGDAVPRNMVLEEDLASLKRTAKQSGIEIVGSVFRGVEVINKSYEEMMICAEYREYVEREGTAPDDLHELGVRR